METTNMPSTSVYLPEEVAARLKKYSATIGAKSSTNNIIVAALTEYLDKHERSHQWSDDFLQWAEGKEEIEGIEIERSEWREIDL
ncbi:MAG: hypothetical protein ACFCU5_12615 [Pleurocapsa sp.]